ncbi:MAG: ATP-binding cassette domain-containing protein [Clostridia bacterium]|nr:ATP-binding cassette domain-containing protein [Clostridia bacterium]
MEAIYITHLKKVYDKTVVINDLSLSIPQGELFVLLGGKNSGKSTLLKMLACLVPPTSGDAALMGYSITGDKSRAMKTLQYTPHEMGLSPELTTRENLELFASFYGLHKREAQERAGHIMGMCDLVDKEHTKVKDLPLGLQQRLSFAMAIVSHPAILLVDEFAHVLPHLAKREIWHMLMQVKRKITLVLATENTEEADILADRIGVLVNGRLCAVGTKDELLTKTGTHSLAQALAVLQKDEEAAV